jgi:transcriptional regulator with XRE-family HTH domain
MSIGANIKRIRNLKGMTQKELGLAIGFDQRTADVRIAQYETGKRTPKENLIQGLAFALDVEPMALTTPDIDSDLGLMHTLFAIEDLYGITITKIDDGFYLRIKKNSKSYQNLNDRFRAWKKESDKLKDEDISEEDYNHWRYNYPAVEVERQRERQDELRKKN